MVLINIPRKKGLERVAVDCTITAWKASNNVRANAIGEQDNEVVPLKVATINKLGSDQGYQRRGKRSTIKECFQGNILFNFTVFCLFAFFQFYLKTRFQFFQGLASECAGNTKESIGF